MQTTCVRNDSTSMSFASDAILFDPDWAEPYHNRGCAYFNAHEFDKALADMDKAIQLDGRKSLYFGNRSKVHQAKGDQAAAQQDAKKAEQLGRVEAK